MNISGEVIHGNNRGKHLGFPTANIKLGGKEGIDAGIYAGRAIFDKNEYICALYVGPDRNLLETHILDFEGDLYGKRLDIHIHHKIRSGCRFESEEALKNAIANDIKKTRRYFGQI